MNNNLQEINNLIKSSKLYIKEKINIDDLNNLLLLFENNKPIPIKYYSKNLIEIKSKNKCSFCSKTCQYKCNDILYCWSCSHTLK